MEDLLAQEQTTHKQLIAQLAAKDQPIEQVLNVLAHYRTVCERCMFKDFRVAKEGGLEPRLWTTHSQVKSYFHRELKILRKEGKNKPVETRKFIKLYLEFLKSSERFYRDYVHNLNTRFGGIAELEEVAHLFKTPATNAVSKVSAPSELREPALLSCHQTLIYLGDLSRYRASERLDKEPDFRPAMGYYGLAGALRPVSGMAHHQQAVIALEQRQHMRAIYHLYRAIVVQQPHPNAAQNLEIEFGKTISAWDKGELIRKGGPTDQDASRNALIGWFIRLHSMCFKGEPFVAYEELEREVMTQLAAELKSRSLDGTLMRMLLINLAAQHTAAENFQTHPTEKHQQAFFYFLRINIKSMTTLLRLFRDDLMEAVDDVADGEDLAKRIKPVTVRILPGLRLCSSWLLKSVHILKGLSVDDFLQDDITQLWHTYAGTLALMTTVFPIWDLEEVPEVTYMLEEDADTIGFQPLVDDKTKKIWHTKGTESMKARFCDRGIERVSGDSEMLARVKELLVDGLMLATEDKEAPIALAGATFVHEPLGVAGATVASPHDENVGLVPHESGAASVVAAGQPEVENKAQPLAPVSLPHQGSSSSRSRHAQLSRMVDDLVDDDDNVPVTPPQQHLSNPAVIASDGETSYAIAMENHAHQTKAPIFRPPSSRLAGVSAPPGLRTSLDGGLGTSSHRLHSMSSLWNDVPAPFPNTSSQYPAGTSTGARYSPVQSGYRTHSRVNSATSMRSRNSQNLADSWSTPPGSLSASGTLSNGYTAFDQSGMASPLLFGAGGGPWSSGPTMSFSNTSPPNGQGG